MSVKNWVLDIMIYVKMVYINSKRWQHNLWMVKKGKNTDQ